jgi:hypothetical protein
LVVDGEGGAGAGAGGFCVAGGGCAGGGCAGRDGVLGVGNGCGVCAAAIPLVAISTSNPEKTRITAIIGSAR